MSACGGACARMAQHASGVGLGFYSVCVVCVCGMVLHECGVWYGGSTCVGSRVGNDWCACTSPCVLDTLLHVPKMLSDRMRRLNSIVLDASPSASCCVFFLNEARTVSSESEQHTTAVHGFTARTSVGHGQCTGILRGQVWAVGCGLWAVGCGLWAVGAVGCRGCGL